MSAGLPPDAPTDAGPHRRADHRWPPLLAADLMFAAMVIVAVSARLHYLVFDGAPVGVDPGNWLAYGHALLGVTSRPEGVVYPPLVPLVVTAAVALLGPTVGIVAVGAVSAVAPGVAVYIVARQTVGSAAPLLAGILLLSPAAGAIAAWGGYPQLIGTGCVIVATWCLAGWLGDGTRRLLVAVVVGSTLVLATSHAAAAAGLAGAGGCALVALVRGGRRVAGQLVIVAVASAAAAVPLMPLYQHLLHALINFRATEPATVAVPISETPAHITVVHGGAWPVWAVGWLLACITVTRDRGRTRLGVMTAGFLVGLPALFVVTGQPRVLYEAPLVAVLGLTLATAQAQTNARWRSVVAVVAVALVIVATAGMVAAPRQRAAYAVLDRDLLAAIAWMGDHSPRDATVAAPAIGNAPLGWWVEGLTRRQVVSAAPLRWLVFPAERDRARIANDLLYRLGVPTREGIRRAARLGIDYVLLAKTGPAYHPSRVERWRHHVVFDNAAAVVVKVGPSS